MTTQERRILNTAVIALERTTGMGVHVLRTTAGRRGPVHEIVEVEIGRRKHRFRAEVKTVDRLETPAIVKARNWREPPLLAAPYVTREVAERCRQLHLPFIDTAGNAYLEGAGLLVYVVGQARPLELRQDRFRALNPAGLKVIFALLCDPGLLHANYREIAARAGVALGTVGPVMQDLGNRRFILVRKDGHRKLINPERMLEEWVTHYATTLRPKLSPRRFSADPKRLQETDLTPLRAFWGGEPAAEKLTRHLKPAQFTIYTREPIAKLVAAGRMRAEENGNVEILEKFWNLAADKNMPAVVPPILAYADLLATRDGRNLEAARIIYEERIAPAFRIPE